VIISVIIPGMVQRVGKYPAGNLEPPPPEILKVGFGLVVKYARGLKTVFVSSRTSYWRHKTSCSLQY